MTYEDIFPRLPIKYSDEKKETDLLNYLKKKFGSPEELNRVLNKFPALTQDFDNLFKNYKNLMTEAGYLLDLQNTPVKDEVKFFGVVEQLFKLSTGHEIHGNKKAYCLMISLLTRRQYQVYGFPERHTKSKEQKEAALALKEDHSWF